MCLIVQKLEIRFFYYFFNINFGFVNGVTLLVGAVNFLQKKIEKFIDSVCIYFYKRI